MNKTGATGVGKQGAKLTVLSDAFALFNVTAHELEHSYSLLNEQIKKLHNEVEEKNMQLERNLIEKEGVKNLLSNILESLPTGVVVVDLEGRLLMCNNAVKKITGVSPSGMDNIMFCSWLNDFDSSDDGTKLSSYGVREFEYNRADSDVRNLKILKSPVIDGNGKNIGVLFILEDQTLLKKLEVQSERDQRLKAMGEMAVRIAHEVRNPLGSIELFASILKKELESRSDLKKMTEHIISQVKGLDNSISNLLLMTKPLQPMFHKISMPEFMGEFIEFISPVLTKNDVSIIYEKSTSSMFVSGDRDLLKQVFLNLTLNSMHALQGGGSILIKIRISSHDSKWVEIEFTDNGTGIPADCLNRIFHPFYTNREKGTGLGLSIVHNIVESHGGTIEVRSKAGKGTTFLVSIPGLSGREV